jgi:hypothetical protein
VDYDEIYWDLEDYTFDKYKDARRGNFSIDEPCRLVVDHSGQIKLIAEKDLNLASYLLIAPQVLSDMYAKNTKEYAVCCLMEDVGCLIDQVDSLASMASEVTFYREKEGD